MNDFKFNGRLAKDPQSFISNSGIEYVKLDIICEKDYEVKSGRKKNDYFHCIAYDKEKDNILKFLKKGNKVLVKKCEINAGYINENYIVQFIIKSIEFI